MRRGRGRGEGREIKHMRNIPNSVLSQLGDEDYVPIVGRSNPLISPPAFGNNVRTRNITVEILDDNRWE